MALTSSGSHSLGLPTSFICFPTRFTSRSQRLANPNVGELHATEQVKAKKGRETDSGLAKVFSKLSLNPEAAVFVPTKPATPLLVFRCFMDLPRETLENVFEYVLGMEKPILPHLCDKDAKRRRPKFHDDNASSHNSIFTAMSLTRVSKKVREVSLPTFYATNTFAVGSDTVTYFAYLASVGRFELVRRVIIDISFQSEMYAAWILRCVNQFDKDVESYENKILKRFADTVDQCAPHGSPFDTSPGTDADHDEVTGKLRPLSTGQLSRHPRYLVGGVSDLSLAILIRMLSTVSLPNSEFTSRIVLPVSNADAFKDYTSLRWFPSMVEGLGMELCFVVRPRTATLSDRRVTLEWNRRFQGVEYAREAIAGSNGESSELILKRALEMYPDLEKMRRPTKTCYYRRSCRSSGSITWYDMPTKGGGHW